VAFFLALALEALFFFAPNALSKFEAYLGVEPTRRIVTASFPYSGSSRIELSITEYCMKLASRQVGLVTACFKKPVVSLIVVGRT